MQAIKTEQNGHSSNGVHVEPVNTKDLPPHSQEAEQATLGGILINPDAFFDVSEFLQAEHFYTGKHQEIFKAVAALRRENIAIDVITLGEILKNKVDDVYLYGLLNAVPNSLDTRHYGRIVHSLYMRRRLMQAASTVLQLAKDESKSINGIIESVENVIHSATDGATHGGPQTIKEGMNSLIDATQQRIEAGSDMIGLPTGFIDLDRMLQGLKPTEVYTLAGRPGMGKSIMERCIALHVARKGKRVLCFNLEMGRESVWQRTIAIETGLDLQRIRNGRLQEHEIPIFMEAAGRLSTLNMWVDDTSSIPLSQLAAKCRRAYAEQGIDLITIDYLQLITTDGRYQNRTQEVGEISRGLKRLAKDLNVPILALAQLSRSCEARADKRPLLSDLRESGDIEQDSDVVMFIYRDEYYNPDDTARAGIAEIHIAKHRNGPTGEIDLQFSGKSTTMKNLAPMEFNI